MAAEMGSGSGDGLGRACGDLRLCDGDVIGWGLQAFAMDVKMRRVLGLGRRVWRVEARKDGWVENVVCWGG